MRHIISPLFAVFFVAVLSVHALSQTQPKPSVKKPVVKMTEDRKVVHALNRLTFGPRPGDVEAVKKMGLSRWIDRQLDPSKIDDASVDAKLAKLGMLQFKPDELQVCFATDQPQFRRRLQAIEAAKRNGSTEEPPSLNPQEEQMYQKMQTMNLQQGASIQAVGELVNGKLVRSVESNRQLQEVLVDFWANHSNVDVKKGPVGTYKIADERDVIRPHVLGKFRELLGADAKSPAMLFYLDNFRSTRAAMGPLQRQLRGLNENYAREIMELHTLGVDGGYTQKDVQEVARCLTGWSFDREGSFSFNRIAHDDGEKVVLGTTIAAGGGIEDGEKVLDILCKHPSTAKFIAFKMCRRFVSDDPPIGLVGRIADIFRKTDGDLKAVTRAIITSKEFSSGEAYGAKVKSPFEFAVSAVRALGGEYEVPDPSVPFSRQKLLADGAVSAAPNGGPRQGMRRVNSLAEQIGAMGQPLYSYIAPTGYPENSQEWISSGGLIGRINFTLALTAGQVTSVRLPGAHSDGKALDDRGIRALEVKLTGLPLSDNVHAAIARQVADTPDTTAQDIAALILGSPDFQHR